MNLPAYAITPTDGRANGTRLSLSRRDDGMTHREHSAVTLNLALAIADDVARVEVESFAAGDWDDTGERVIYDLSRLVDYGERDAGEAQRNLAAAQRAARYIDLRHPHLPYVMHRDPDNPARVWFTDKEQS